LSRGKTGFHFSGSCSSTSSPRIDQARSTPACAKVPIQVMALLASLLLDRLIGIASKVHRMITK
jgi:hypothetical protein